MSSLSSLQAATLDAFRKANPGPVSVILEDGQGYNGLIGHLTGVPTRDAGDWAGLARRNVALCVNGFGNGRPGQVNLAEVFLSYQWCFILFQGTFGRDDIATQIDRLLGAGQRLDRLVLANYYLDHANAKDGLRRLFALVPSVQLYFADAQHLFEIDADNYANPQSARLVAQLFAQLRKAGLLTMGTNFREYSRCVEAVGPADEPDDVARIVRGRLVDRANTFYPDWPPWLPPRGEWDRLVESAVQAFLAAVC